MPLYHYKCHACGLEKEELRKISERNSKLECPCGADMQIQLGTAIFNPNKDFHPRGELSNFLSKLKSNTKGAGNFRT